jgi:orotate phosphoribosyltransferase
MDERGMRMHLFVAGEFVAHSGGVLPYKIDCDALSSSDIETIAGVMAWRLVRFSSVYGVPRGGIRLELAFQQYSTGSALDPLLIVDDVLTTGRSMIEARARFGPNTIGFVIFARGPCPEWITPFAVVQ